MPGPIDPFSHFARLREIKALVEEHPDQPLTLTDAAKLASLEPKSFSALFKKVVGLSFIEWLHRVRIEKAKELLRETDIPVTDVASEVGFGSLRTLERVFKKQTGTTPHSYRSSIEKHEN